MKCEKCKKKINEDDDNYCSIFSYNHGKMTEQKHFHMQCWSDYFKECVIKKQKDTINGLFSRFKGFTRNVTINGNPKELDI